MQISRCFHMVLLTFVLGGGAALAQNTGPSTATSPYLLPSTSGVSTTSVLTVGDSIGGYRMVGIPDGLGGFGSDTSWSLMMHHELGWNVGVPRAHGSAGAFVSRWELNDSLMVTSGRDHNTNPNDVFTWNGAGYTAGTTAWNRLCSADLAATSAFSYNGYGTTNRLFLGGEEYDERFPVDPNHPDHGRAFAHVATGADANTSWQLPRLGRMAFENAVASPHPQLRTVVVPMDDADRVTNPQQTLAPSELYVYIGTKTNTGNDIERAGLTNGNLYGVRVGGVTAESNTLGQALGGSNSGTFSLYNFGNVENTSGVDLQDMSIANDITRFQRLEDGAWDPRPGQENDYYFVTTASFSSNSRLWRMRFNDVENPEAGGVLEVILDGDAGQKMFDNLCIDQHGRILLQEDVGNNARLGKVWLYDIDSGGFVEVAAHSADYFTSGGPNFLTIDEESSGIIDASQLLGDGWFLLDVQAHHALGGELVEGGQLVAMYVDPSIIPEPATVTALAVVALLGRRSRRN